MQVGATGVVGKIGVVVVKVPQMDEVLGVNSTPKLPPGLPNGHTTTRWVTFTQYRPRPLLPRP